MSKLNSDWDFFCALLESRGHRGPTTRLTGGNFLIVIVQNQEEKIPGVRSHSDIFKDTREITVLLDNKRLDCEGIDKIVNELNCSDKIHYILLCYTGEKNYADMLCRVLRRSGKLIRKIPMVISLPQKVYNQVTNPA